MSFAFGTTVSSCTHASPRPSVDERVLAGILVADAHAHPDQFYAENPRKIDRSSTLAAIVESRMTLSVFAAVGDSLYLRQDKTQGNEYYSTKAQLERVRRLAAAGKIKLVLRSSDLPDSVASASPPCAVLAIEGGDPLQGDPVRLDDFYNVGARMITLVHYHNNELGDAMMPHPGKSLGPANNGLTSAGRKVVEKMQSLGMIVDVAHADLTTLKQVADISRKPIIDSHTSPLVSSQGSEGRRRRTWEEMELVARTGGVVCTWPLALSRDGVNRKTFAHWAQEILEMKGRLGIAHVGLGTDGGGNLPARIAAYRDVRDLDLLAAAMLDVGLSREDLASYMGGNFLRVLRECLA